MSRVAIMSEVSAQTWDLVGQEIAATLNDARASLETFSEQPDNVGVMEQCSANLAHIQGVLRVLEIYGAALLAEEMTKVARYLIDTMEGRKNHEEALDALLRSMVQLPGYLERVMAGGRDMALILLPLLNDLRAVRGSPLLSEGTLLLINLRSDKLPTPQPSHDGKPTLTVQQWARRMRTQYQTGLIGWIRSEGAAEHLVVLASVAEQLERVATEQCVYQLWWVTAAVIEALRDGGLEPGISVKRLLGLADREIRRLYEQGEPRYAQNPPVELLNNLLYYVARSTSHGTRVKAVRRSFRLDELLPVDPSVEAERETLSAPSIKLMQTVAVAIREDLSKIKDVLDIYVRRGGGPPAELAPQVEMLRKIGDTLGVLGLGDLRASIQKELANLEGIVSGALPATDALLVQIATAVITVEDKLDSSLVSLLVPARKPDAQRSETPDVTAEFAQVQAAVLRECTVNLARIKEAMAQRVGGTLDSGALDHWPELMRGIKAGMLMLGRGRAASVVDGIGNLLRRVMQAGGPVVPAQFLDRLADAIVSLEYYMETLQAGRNEPAYMLDNAQACIDALQNQPLAAVPTVAAADGATVLQPALSLRDAPALSPIATTQVLTDSQRFATSPGAAAESADLQATLPPLLPAQRLTVNKESVDPELQKIFIEEASEESAKIATQFPLWEKNTSDASAMRSMRRSFHTLKGSGRMVGALEMAEFSWSMENLLNRLLDGTLERSAAIVSTLREAVAVVPQLVDGLANGLAAPAAIASLLSRAHALAAGQHDVDVASPAETTVAAREAPTEQQREPPTPTNIDSDPSLRDIYRRETDSHIATIREFITRERGRKPPHVLTDSVYRACHTLSGSSRMAEVRHGTRLAEPLDRWLRKSFGSGVGLTDEDLMLLDECMVAMQYVAQHLDESTIFFTRHDVLRARLAGSEADLDQRIAEAATGDGGESIEMSTPLDIDVGDASSAAQEIDFSLTSADEPTAATPDLITDIADFAATMQDASAAAEAAQAAQAVQAPIANAQKAETKAAEAEEIETDADFDPDIALIFTEEATELLEAGEAALRDWNTSRTDPMRLSALKRPLHTLKGGARMAGIRSMGDLSHELESLIGDIELGNVKPTDQTYDILQASLDELAHMRENVAAGRPLRPARALLARIHAFVGAAPAAAEVAAPAAPAAAASPTAAPVVSSPAPAVAAPPIALTPAILPVATPSTSAPTTRDWIAARATPEVTTAAATVAPDAPVAGAAEPAAVPPGREPVPGADRAEMARVDADLLDQLLNNAGEVSIGRARLEQQVGAIDHNLGELSRTVTRLKEQLRKLEIETERQILHRHESESSYRGEFDPLELDRYSSIQQFSRALAETASDVGSIQQLLETLTQDTQNLLQQQARVVTELQNGLMRTRMVPFQRHVQRLGRIVRQAATDTGKRAELVVEGAAGELDRQVLDRMLPPFEHMLRNAVVHGIESPEERRARGKDETGRITLLLRREGAEVIVEVSDDGAGMNLRAIRDKALALGMTRPGQSLSDSETLQLVLEPGFSTADSITQHAGRGVGMDVVATEVKKLGGGLHMESEAGRGTKFTVRLPFTLAISHALVVRAADEYYALPLPTIEGVVRLSRDDVERHLLSEMASYEYGNQKYRFQPLGSFVGLEAAPLPTGDVTVPVVLVRAGDHSTGIVCEELIGSREIVVKSVGPQVSAIRGISGATILGDGRIVVILDMAALVRADWRARAIPVLARDKVDSRPVALVVDDSITVRRVTQRLLERNGMRVITARDGLDAVAVLAENMPDIILLDIEMPRMDGYEFAAHVRNDPRTAAIPIIMITSRVGDKHRARAIELGVDDYLGKPYQEAQLLEAIEPLLSRRADEHAAQTHDDNSQSGYGD